MILGAYYAQPMLLPAQLAKLDMFWIPELAQLKLVLHPIAMIAQMPWLLNAQNVAKDFS
jgi:hypothetical protein